MPQNKTYLGTISESVWHMLRQLFKSLCDVNILIYQKKSCSDLESIDLKFRTYFEDAEKQYQNLSNFADAVIPDQYYICTI